MFVTQNFGPQWGGMDQRHVQLCRRFVPERVLVSTVRSVRADGPAFDRAEPYTIIRQPFAQRDAKRSTNTLRWAAWLAGRCGPGTELIHCGEIRPTSIAVWWAAGRARVPYLLYVNGLDLLLERRRASRPRLRVLARALMGGAAGIVANSAWTAETAADVMHRVGVPRLPPIAAIDLGTDPDEFHPTRDTGALRARLGLGNAPLLLTVARLLPHKGQDVAIRAVALLAGEFPELRYLIIGAGPHEQALRHLVADLGIANRVLFETALSTSEVAEAHATATLYVGPSRLHDAVNVEGFGLAFAEAGASGTAVIAGDSGGVRSAVRHGETGLVVPPAEERAVAGAIRDLLRDASRREAMGRRGRALAEAYYNWDRVASETLDFARSVVRSRQVRHDGPGLRKWGGG
ncbi:MAG: glycosyltransferase family 4 protein, partial [Gemmatimonadota bacterium]|nr:glycosyltransferase family 4 protein [Gemmatimonadota bacterium]